MSRGEADRLHLDHEGPDEEDEQGDQHDGRERTHVPVEDSSEGARTVRFLTRRGCPLCEEAYALVVPEAVRRGIVVDVRDVDLDLELLDRFDHRVPVLLDPGRDRVLAEGHIGPVAVDAALTRLIAGR
jgi:hypothetical protein